MDLAAERCRKDPSGQRKLTLATAQRRVAPEVPDRVVDPDVAKAFAAPGIAATQDDETIMHHNLVVNRKPKVGGQKTWTQDLT